MEISREVAVKLCQEIQLEHRGKWYTLLAWFCPVCAKIPTKEGVPGCLISKTGFDGCGWVNRRYQAMNTDRSC